jgi:predicted Zn-dependent protease
LAAFKSLERFKTLVRCGDFTYFALDFCGGEDRIFGMPEKPFSQISRPLREQYEKGKTALERRNYDYAVAIFSGVLDQEPAFFDCRQLLRVTQHKKYEGGGSGFFKKMVSGASSSPLVAKGQFALRNDPLEALKIAEQILNSNPTSVQGHKLLADAALAADLPKTAILSLEILGKNSPKDQELQKNLARAFAQTGSPGKAETIFAELVRLNPGDARLMEELKDASARKTLSEGGYDALSEGKGSYRDILKDKDQAVALEQENRQVKDVDVAARLIQEKEAQLAGDPKNLKLLRTIGELYTQQKEWDRALEAYHRIVASEGAADPALQKTISEITIRKYDHTLSQLDPQAADYAEQSARLKAERDNYMLTECKERADKYPNDLLIRFELGKLYFQAGKTSEAIQELQKAQNNPNRRIQALCLLGQCFARRNMNDLAAKTLEKAIAEKEVFDDEKKEIIYALGTVLEKMGKAAEAIEEFKLIYEVDAAFKDVSKKIDDFYASS